VACLYCPNHSVLFSIPLPNYVEAEITKLQFYFLFKQVRNLFFKPHSKNIFYRCLGRWLSIVEKTWALAAVMQHSRLEQMTCGITEFVLGLSYFFLPSFLSFSVWPLQSSHRRCRRLLLHFITLGRISLDEWSALRRDLYLAAQHSHKREISTPLAGFEPAIPASKRLQAHALDRADTSSYLPDYYHQRLIKEDDMSGACITHTVWVRNAQKLGEGSLGDKGTHRRTIWQWYSGV